MFVAFLQPVLNTIAKENAQDKSAQVIAYYFHGDFRCVTCRNLEGYAREAIESNFKTELNAGAIIFKAVNVQKKENEHFINDYQLYSKALVLLLQKEGKEIRYKNLDKIWQLVGNKKKYLNYVKREMASFIKEKK